ncbi:MAG: histidine phosphatase family protein [Desulfobacterales bacterium]|jgi:broad specificity phosphatase PhoE
MQIVIYRHAKPVVSWNEIISGRDFPSWVSRYNNSGIIKIELGMKKEKIVLTSNLKRSMETGKLIGEKIIPNSLFCEAEVPLIQFPTIRMRAKFWMALSRFLWLFGLKKNCESFKNAKKRVIRIIENIESHLLENQRVVIVGHGFINRLIKKKLIHRGWSLSRVEDDNKFLGKMTFHTEQPLTPF